MTTIVLDLGRGLGCSDSRWSIPRDFGVLYTDDAPFYKISVTPDEIWLFAGLAPQIDNFKRYLMQYPTPSGRPDVHLSFIDQMAIIVAGKDGQIKGWHQVDIMRPSPSAPSFVAAGTGSTYAAAEWLVTKDPMLAIEAAKKRDISSGGQVMFVNLATLESNVGACHGVGCLDQSFIKTGKVMFTNDAKVYSFEEAAKLHPEVKKLFDSAATGGLSNQVQAPCDAIYNSATDEQKKEFLTKVGIPVSE